MTKSTISLDSVVRASPRQVSTELGSETVILGVDRGQYFGLDAVGARLWALVQEPTSVEALCLRLLEEYEVSRASLEADVLELLSELRDQGLLDVGGGLATNRHGVPEHAGEAGTTRFDVNE